MSHRGHMGLLQLGFLEAEDLWGWGEGVGVGDGRVGVGVTGLGLGLGMGFEVLFKSGVGRGSECAVGREDEAKSRA